MERGKPHHGHQRQSEEEAVAAAGDVVEERTQALPVQEEVMEAAGDADHQFDFFVDSIAVGEAFATPCRWRSWRLWRSGTWCPPR